MMPSSKNYSRFYPKPRFVLGLVLGNILMLEKRLDLKPVLGTTLFVSRVNRSDPIFLNCICLKKQRA